MSRPWRQQQKPRITPDEVKFAEFTGVINTRSRKDIGLGALVAGDNVLVSDSKKVTRRDGYTPHRATGTVQSAYGCGDRLYVVDNGSLIHMASATDDRVLTTGLANKPYSWDDINGDAYFVNGVDAGIARGDTYLPWRLAVPGVYNQTAVSASTAVAPTFNVGETYATATFRICATYETADGRETAPSEIVELVAAPDTNLIRVQVPSWYARTNVYCTEADGTVFRLVATSTAALTATVTFNPARGLRELTTVDMFSLPQGVTHIAFLKGRCYAAQYLPAQDATVVWISQPFAYHLWNPSKDFITVAGEVALLLWNNKGMLIGTTSAIYQHSEDGELEMLVDYGVVPGMAGDTSAEGMAYFWTTRGVCQAMPFKNLTEEDVSMAPGARAVAAMVYINGMQQFITVTQGGGEAFNQRRERT